MCGIAGILELSGRPVDRDALLRMTRALAHRGPDDEGTFVAGAVGLGHRRLAIRDLSPAGHQPISDPTGRITVSYNGEIYNEAELRRALERDHGARFRSRCDAELLPAGYLAWREGLFERLEGMFAIALWDAAERRLVLARDPMGIKPLVASRTGSTWRFASELKGLLADPAQPRRLDPEGLHAFLAQGYVGPTATTLSGVESLAPGTWRSIEAAGGRVVERRFFEPARRPEVRRLDEAVDAFLPAFREVLSGITVSDVPIGVLGSGGIDSSLVALALRERAELPVFTACFADPSHDESPRAAEIAALAGQRHHRVPVEEGDVESEFRAVVRHFDGQVADASGLAFHVLARAVRKHATVVLSGDGADELFGGYDTYRATRVASALARWLPADWLRAAGRAAGRLGGAREERLPPGEIAARFLLGAGSPGAAHAEWRRLVFGEDLPRLYGPALQPVIDRDPLAAYVRALAGPGALVDRCLLADQRHYLPGDLLPKVDAMSMAHALEVRVPFLERRVIAVAERLDARVLCPLFGRGKRVLRAALARLGAPPSVTRAPKHGFNVPVSRTLRGPLAPLAERLLVAEAERLAPFLDPAGTSALWREHRERRRNHGFALWALLTHAAFVEDLEASGGAALAPPPPAE
jgi:asparagine synthase (glutamine-hydrolysing)